MSDPVSKPKEVLEQSELSANGRKEPIECGLCGQLFIPRKASQKFCKNTCKEKFHVLAWRIGILVLKTIKKDSGFVEFIMKGGSEKEQ